MLHTNEEDLRHAERIRKLKKLIKLYDRPKYHPECPLREDFVTILSVYGPQTPQALRSKLNVSERVFTIYLERLIEEHTIYLADTPSVRTGTRTLVFARNPKVYGA